MLKIKIKQKKYEEEEDPGCFPDTHAQCFEIALIICFAISCVLLIVNTILTLWFFKSNYVLLILEIILITLNIISIILSVILRLWRSDGSVFKKNFSSSKCVSCLLLVLIIINEILTILEEVLFYLKTNGSDSNTVLSIVKIIDKAKKKGYDVKSNDSKKKILILKYLPWVAFVFNNVIQLIMLFLDCFLKRRIQLKSHLGFPKRNKSKSSQSKMLGSTKKKRKSSSLFTSNETDEAHFKKRKKKMKKRRTFKKKKYY